MSAAPPLGGAPWPASPSTTAPSPASPDTRKSGA